MTDFTQLLGASVVLVPLVVGVIEALKRAGLPTSFAPSAAILLGVGAEFLAAGTVVTSPSIGVTLLLGVGVGLGAAGLYSGAKTTFSA